MPDVLLDYETVKKGLATLAEDQPDFVYRAPMGTCFYNSYEAGTPFVLTSNGEKRGPSPISGPGCGIGVLLTEAGVSEETLREFDRKADSASDLPFWADDFAKRLAQRFQSYQDVGVPWGSAFERALEEVESHRGVEADNA